MLEKLKNLFKPKNKEAENSVSTQIDNLFDNLDEYIVCVKVGEDLSKKMDTITNTIEILRDEIKDECGFILPEVFITFCAFMQENEFSVLIRGRKVVNEFLVPNNEGIRQEFYEILKTQLYDNLDEVFTNELTERYIDSAWKKNMGLVCTLTRCLSVVDIRTILIDIISCGKSINNISYIFEQIGEHILSNGSFAECGWKEYNPHKIADVIAKKL